MVQRRAEKRRKLTKIVEPSRKTPEATVITRKVTIERHLPESSIKQKFHASQEVTENKSDLLR